MQKSLSCGPEEKKDYMNKWFKSRNLHGLKVGSKFGTAQLKLLDNVRDLLKPEKRKRYKSSPPAACSEVLEQCITYGRPCAGAAGRARSLEMLLSRRAGPI